MRRLVALVAAVAVALGVAGEAAAPDVPAPEGDAAAFLERVVRQVVRNDYARAWLSLHPAHRRVAGRWEYVDCENQSPIRVGLGAVEVVAVADADRQLGPAKTVTLRLTLTDPEYGSSQVEQEFHAIAVAGRWAWVLPPERFALYRDDACGGGPEA